MTIGEAYGPILDAKTQGEAIAAFDRVADYLLSEGHAKNRDEANRMVRENLGYYSGYYDAETARRVNSWIGTTHPIFGGR